MRALKLFRRRSEEIFKGSRHRTRYPTDLKNLALKHLEQSRAKGFKLKDAAKQLDIDANTLRTWIQEAEPSAAPKARLKRVKIVEALPAYLIRVSGGVEVECRDAHSAAALIKALA